VDNLESNWAYMVMTALAWNLKACVCAVATGESRSLGRTPSPRERDTVADGVQDVRERVPAATMPDYSRGPTLNLSPAELESLAARVLPHVRSLALLTNNFEAGVRMLRSAAATQRSTDQNER
jgi:hypothetical protein